MAILITAVNIVLAWVHHGTKFAMHLLGVFDVVRCSSCTCFATRGALIGYLELVWLGRQVDVRARAFDFILDEFEVLGEDLIRQSFHIDRLAHRLLNPFRRVLHLFVLQFEILLDIVHRSAIAFNCAKLIIWARLGDLVKDL